MGIEIQCDECTGLGYIEAQPHDPETDFKTCPKCNGNKEVDADFNEVFEDEIIDLGEAIEDFVDSLKNHNFTRTAITEAINREVREQLKEHNK